MKANELTVGDLARVNRDGLCIKKDTIVQVRSIDGDDKIEVKGLFGSAHCRPLDESQSDGGIWLDYLDPIPITPEILEKNGFTNYGESWYIPKTEDCIMVGFHMYETTINITKDRVSFYKSVPCKYRSCYISRKVFVHELQQAINLCGIERQITV